MSYLYIIINIVKVAEMREIFLLTAELKLEDIWRLDAESTVDEVDSNIDIYSFIQNISRTKEHVLFKSCYLRISIRLI